MNCFDRKNLDRYVISGPILELIKNHIDEQEDYDELRYSLYESDEFKEAIDLTLRWAYEYVKEHG